MIGKPSAARILKRTSGDIRIEFSGLTGLLGEKVKPEVSSNSFFAQSEER